MHQAHDDFEMSTMETEVVGNCFERRVNRIERGASQIDEGRAGIA